MAHINNLVENDDLMMRYRKEGQEIQKQIDELVKKSNNKVKTGLSITIFLVIPAVVLIPAVSTVNAILVAALSFIISLLRAVPFERDIKVREIKIAHLQGLYDARYAYWKEIADSQDDKEAGCPNG